MKYIVQTPRSKAVCSTYGGEMISYVHNGIEYLWAERQNREKMSVRFPIVWTNGEETPVENGVSSLSSEGFAGEKDFTPVLLTPETIGFVLQDTAETQAVFPFRFALNSTCTVSDNGYTVSVALTNREERAMTYGMGLRAGFRCPIAEGETWEDYEIVFPDGEDVFLRNALSVAVPRSKQPPRDLVRDHVLRLTDIPVDAPWSVQNFAMGQVKLVSRKSGRGILVAFSGCHALDICLCTDAGEPALCLEPWCGFPVDTEITGNGKKQYARTLRSGDTHTVGYTVTILETTKRSI